MLLILLLRLEKSVPSEWFQPGGHKENLKGWRKYKIVFLSHPINYQEFKLNLLILKY